MTFDKEAGKALIQSKAFWGTVLTAAGVFVPRYATALQGATDDIVVIIGLAVTAFGRFTATQPVTGILTAKR